MAVASRNWHLGRVSLFISENLDQTWQERERERMTRKTSEGQDEK